jgi:hypothetical protein
MQMLLPSGSKIIAMRQIGGQLLDAELHIVLFQMRDRGVEILHFERGATAVRVGFESRRAADGQRIRTKLIFGPLAVLTIGYGGWLQISTRLHKNPERVSCP